MATEHNTITDPNIHEPKGVSTATIGEVYVADGSGSGEWTSPYPSQTGNSGKSLTTDGTDASWTSNNRVLARASITSAAGTPAVAAGGVNVASCTRNSTGNWTVTFTSALANTSYQVMVQLVSFSSFYDLNIYVPTKGTSSVQVSCIRDTLAAADVGSFDIVIFG